jgi:nucleotide-binding universal stress UspA family protein
MIEIRRILCPIDFSEHSRRAIEEAVPIARWYGATLIGMHVTPVGPRPGSLDAGVGASAWDPIPQARILGDLTEWLAPARAAGVPTETLVATGPTAGVIAEQAEDLAADLVVMGTHGRGGFERFLLGSVTEKVLRIAPCPVLAVPHAHAHMPRRDRPVFKSIVCGVDFSEASLVALRFAFSLAEEGQARIAGAYVMEPVLDEETLLRTRFDIVEFRRFVRENALRRLEGAFPADVRDWCTAEAVVLSGKPYESLVTLAGQRGADLIVLGVHSRRELHLRLFGSTSHHVIREAPCPVLTVGRQARVVSDHRPARSVAAHVVGAAAGQES